MSKSAFIIAATNSNCGKTTVSLGLMRAFTKRGLDVAPFKVGPDYIDPTYHKAATGNPSRNLDSYMLDEDTIKYLFHKNSCNSDLSIIEGVMGLYDGLNGTEITGSTAHLSQILDVPVILLVDGKGMSLSIAAMINGYKNFLPGLKFAGVIINNIKGSTYMFMKDIIEQHCDLSVLGYLPYDDRFMLSSRHLGLVMEGEIQDIEQKIDLIADGITECIDLDKILKCTKFEAKSFQSPILPKKIDKEVNIAYAFDKAFNFYYEDNLDLLRELGANLIPISPINDKKLPDDIHGLILGGGYPEVFAGEVSANSSFISDLRDKLSNNLPCYAECGGYMYLGRTIADYDGQAYPMANIFPFDFQMTESLDRFGYMKVNYDNFFGLPACEIKGHEFHYSKAINSNEGISSAIVSKTRASGKVVTWCDGYKKYNTIAGYVHLHFWSNPTMVKGFIDQCKFYKENEVI